MRGRLPCESCSYLLIDAQGAKLDWRTYVRFAD